MEIEHFKNGIAIDYVVEDVPGVPKDIWFYVYVVDIEARRNHPYAWCAVVTPSDASLPRFVFAPDGGLEGMPYEQVAQKAIIDYVAHNAQALRLLHARRLAELSSSEETEVDEQGDRGSSPTPPRPPIFEATRRLQHVTNLIDEAIMALSELEDEWTEQPSGSTAPLVDEIPRLLEPLHALWNELTYEWIPGAVCPKCRNEPDDHCGTCGGLGWLSTAARYRANLPDDKESDGDDGGVK